LNTTPEGFYDLSRVSRGASAWAGPVDLRKRRTPRAWASGRGYQQL